MPFGYPNYLLRSTARMETSSKFLLRTGGYRVETGWFSKLDDEVVRISSDRGGLRSNLPAVRNAGSQVIQRRSRVLLCTTAASPFVAAQILDHLSADIADRHPMRTGPLRSEPLISLTGQRKSRSGSCQCPGYDKWGGQLYDASVGSMITSILGSISTPSAACQEVRVAGYVRRST